MEQDKIKKQAKEIMDNFLSALSDIEVEEEFELIRKDSFRDENKIKERNLDENFKQRFLSNAQKINGSAIVANKGAWVE